MQSTLGGPAVWGCVGLVCLAGYIFAGGSSSGAKYLFTQAPRYNSRAWLNNGDRFPAGATIRVVASGKSRPLVQDFAATADPALSFDATHVLFAGRQRAGDPWRIWEVALEQGTPRQVSAGDGDCYRPLYLPADQIVYTRRTGVSSQIEIASLDGGGKPDRLTFTPGHFLTADVLRDGRILFEAEHIYAGRSVREIMSVYPDGTGVESIRCDHGADRYAPKEVASGDIVFVEKGRLGRFTSTLAHQTAAVSQSEGEVAGPVAEANGGDLVFAARGDAEQPFRISQLPAAAHAAGMNELEPVVIATRLAPRRFPSALLAIRTAGNLLCLNVATSRDPIRGGAIRAVRVFTQSDNGNPLLLGTQTVEQDGSFFVQVPGDKPLRLEAIDAAGRVVSAERNWWWMRVAEQRACVGCHAGPERAPDNAVPEVLLRKDVPVQMLISAGKNGSKGY